MTPGMGITQHPFATGVSYAAVHPINPAGTPGDTYAFMVFYGDSWGYAVDAQDAADLLSTFARQHARVGA